MPQIILSLNTPEDKIYSSDQISCYLLADTLPDAAFQQAVASGKMVLSIGEKALDLCRQFDLDGVVKEVDPQLPVKIQLKPLREALKKKTLGAIIPARRHEAMLAAEVEPEFIAFRSADLAGVAELTAWYNDLFLMPLAFVASDNPTKAMALDVDFVIINAKDFENFGC